MVKNEHPAKTCRTGDRAQALKLRSLSQEAYQPKLYDKDLSHAEAARRIEVLQQEIALADSF